MVSGEKEKINRFFSHLIVNLAMLNLLVFGKVQIYLPFLSFNRKFNYVEFTSIRKSANLFAFSLI